MATVKAAYYTDEINGWYETIRFYDEEMNEMEEKLSEVIQRNSIMGIAVQVEAHQAKLNGVAEKFYRLQLQMKQQEDALYTDSTVVDDAQINEATESLQVMLRHNMQQTEKEYIDVKYACLNFLSATLKKK